jgi:DNA-binding transcriptional LysR family regulator
MPRILHHVRERYPELEIQEIEVGVPQQLKLILNGRLDVGLGRAYLPPADVAAELVRLDQLGVLIRKPPPHSSSACSGQPPS